MDEASIRKKALRLLCLKIYHSQVLLRKLMEKGGDLKTCQKVIQDLFRQGFLNDQEAILSELKRGLGPFAIERKLKIPREEVQRWISKKEQREKIKQLIQKLGASLKTFQTLKRKGFDLSLLYEYFSSISD